MQQSQVFNPGGYQIMAAAVLIVLALTSGACQGDAPGAVSEEKIQRIDGRQGAQKEAIDTAVRDGELPPVVLAMFEADGTVNPNIVDGPGGDEDIVRTRKAGTAGPKLARDLDRDGRISADEREITERELYDLAVSFYPR